MSKLNKLIENAIKAAALPVRESKSQQIIRRLKEDTAYQEFFKKALEKYGVNSPSDFEGKLREEYFPTHGADSPDVKKAKQALANWFMNISRNPGTPEGARAGTLNKRTLDILHDLIDDYAAAYAEDYKEEWSKEVGL